MSDPTPTQPPTAPTVPEGLLAQWRNQAMLSGLDLVDRQDWMARAAVAWAWAQREPELQARADAELEACCEVLRENHLLSDLTIERLRDARRPAPPTLREQALKALRERLDNPSVVHLPENRAAMELALQALKETPND